MDTDELLSRWRKRMPKSEDNPHEVRLCRTPEPGETRWIVEKEKRVEQTIEEYCTASIYFGGEKVYQTDRLDKDTVHCLSLLYSEMKTHYEETGQVLEVEVGP